MSMTLFLDDAGAYDGGELIINSDSAPQAVKLGRGDAILYPTSNFHRVEPVTRGVRRVVLFWIQSMVRDPQKREILTEMWVALDYLYNLQPAD
jgi:PKHD-type hydroxylase